MATLKIVKCKNSHIEAVAKRMRKCDRDEIDATFACTPEQGLVYSVNVSSKAYTLNADGRHVAIFGVASHHFSDKIGTPWLLATEDYLLAKDWFLTGYRKYLEEAFDTYFKLINHVDARNLTSIDWLQKCGFKVYFPPVPYGVKGMPFHRFEMHKGDLYV